MEWFVCDNKVTNGQESFSNLAFAVDLSNGKVIRYGDFNELRNTWGRLKEFYIQLGWNYDSSNIKLINISSGRDINETCQLANLMCLNNGNKQEMIELLDIYKLIGKKLKSGMYIGNEIRRGRITISNYADNGYFIKCPFPYYYATCGKVRKCSSIMIAYEKNESLENYRNEVMLVAKRRFEDGLPVKELHNVLKNILSAQFELSFYDSDDFIYPLGTSDGSTYERNEIKNKISSLRQKRRNKK